MEPRLCVSEEYRRDSDNSESPVSRIEIRDYKDSDLVALCQSLTRFWSVANGEDLSEQVVYQISGVAHPITKAEAKVYHFLFERCKIMVAVDNYSGIVGFIVYHLAYGSVLAIECLYVEPTHQGKGLAHGLVSSCGDIKRMFFQSSIERHPSKLFGHLSKNAAPKEIGRSDRLITWEVSFHA